MLKCLFIKRKLYDYLENSLTDIERIKVKDHLNVCSNCKDRLAQLKNIIALAAEKKAPEPDSEFWHNFKIDLDRRLNEELVPLANLEPKLSYRLRPVFAYVSALIFILVIVNSNLYKRPHQDLTRIAQEEDLVEEILSLDELDEILSLNEDELLLEEADLS